MQAMKITKNIGMLLLAVYLIIDGLLGFGLQLGPAIFLLYVVAVASGSANEADNFVFPYAPGELDHVLGRGGDIVIVNRRGNKDAVSVFNRRAQFLRTGHTITFVRVAEREVHFADVDPIAIHFLL